MLLVVDNGSVFTGNLISLLSRGGFAPFVTRTPDVLGAEDLAGYDSFILSGRKSNDRETNRANSGVVRHCVRSGSKLLGICYGAEILALTAGGTIRRSSSPRRGSETVEVWGDGPLFAAGKGGEEEGAAGIGAKRRARRTLDVFESHSFEISKLPPTIVPLGGSDNCGYEIIQYRGMPIYGTQFHPEMTRDGHGLIERFCEL